MKIGVCVKSVPDTTAKIQVAADKKNIVEDGLKFVISPYDEFALEQALLYKDQDASIEVVAFTYGGSKGQDTLRTALAMGADRAVFISDDSVGSADGLVTAKVLSQALQKESIDVVLTGRQAIDDDNGQVSQMIAEKLSWPYVTVVSQLEMKSGTFLATRDVEGGAKEVWQVPTKSVIACTKGLNQPRYASLKGIMAAKKKQLDVITVSDLGLEKIAPNIEIVDFELPSTERKNKMFEGATQENVDALVKLLREEAKVI